MAQNIGSGGISPLKIMCLQLFLGAPLGAVDSSDTLSIRVFDAEVLSQIDLILWLIVDPTKDLPQRKFDTIKFESQAGYEKDVFAQDVQKDLTICPTLMLLVLKKLLLKTFTMLEVVNLKHLHLT